MPAIPDVAADLLTRGLPVLFLDTCSLLDVIRGPARPDKLAGCVTAAVELLRLAIATPPCCTLAVASFVPGEWLTHAQPTADDLARHLGRLNDLAASFHVLLVPTVLRYPLPTSAGFLPCGTLSGPPGTTFPAPLTSWGAR